LRVIEYGQYERVGGSQALNANVRLVCATNADLPKLAQEGDFRADLLDRLAFDVIHLPPLRERKEDIVLLAEYFAIRMCRELELPFFAGFTPRAIQSLTEYPWPGNIRELKNVVERAVYQHGTADSPIDSLIFDPFQKHWQEETQEPSATLNKQEKNQAELAFPMDFKQWQEQQDKYVINESLKFAKFNQRQAAKSLGLSYHQFRGLMRKYQLTKIE